MLQESQLPEDFIHLFQDRYFLQATFPEPVYTIVGNEGCWGTRRTYWPFCVEYYTGDKEPTLLPFRGLRVVVWTPISNIYTCKNWFRLFFDSNPSVYACVLIKNKNYEKYWSHKFRNFKNLWLKQQEYVIKKTDLATYQDTYSKYAVPQNTVERYRKRHERHYKLDEQNFHLYVLEHCVSKNVVGGIAVVNCPEIKQAYYLSAFTRKDIAPAQTSFWLLCNWMEEIASSGFHFANLGQVWTKGYDPSWKGFTQFKLKFNPAFIIRQRELIRFTFSL